VNASAAAAVAPDEVRLEVERFLFWEARLLDHERYEEWLELLADDIHYWVPGIENRNRKDELGAYSPGHMAYFDDGKKDLARRIARFTSDTAWSENPPTRHFHLIGNVEVFAGEKADELVVHSLILCHRWRYEKDEDVLYGRREDLLRRTVRGLLLARRRVVLSHNILPAKNLNTFL
jgi:ethylbenzene dioxygenase subunit beta